MTNPNLTIDPKAYAMHGPQLQRLQLKHDVQRLYDDFIKQLAGLDAYYRTDIAIAAFRTLPSTVAELT
jgi:hypothetical protein